MPPNKAGFSINGKVFPDTLLIRTDSVAEILAKDASLGSPVAVLTSKPPEALSLKVTFPRNMVCVPKYNDKNFWVGLRYN